MSLFMQIINLLPTKTIVRMAASVLKSKGLHRYQDVEKLQEIIDEFWRLYRKPDLVRRELDGCHAYFRSLSERIPQSFSPHVGQDERDVIRHGLTALRVFCWSMRLESASDQDILDVISERFISINHGAYQSSYEVFMHELCKHPTWPSDQAERDRAITKIKEWSRANVDRLCDLRDAWKRDLTDYSVLQAALA